MQSNWNQKILLIWLGQSTSLLTSSILQMSIIWYITTETGSAVTLTFATLCAFLPQALLGTFTGVFIDRFNKKKIIILADLFIAGASLLLAIASLQGELPIPLILFVLTLRSIGSAFHEPTVQALTPLIVPQASLTQYAGYAQAFDSVCMLLSPAISIVLYDIWAMQYIILLDILGALVAVALLLCVKIEDDSTTKNSTAIRPPIRIWAETLEGISIMRNQMGILPLMIIGTLYSILYSPIGSLYPHITMVYFEGSIQQSGLVEIIFSCGSLLGALLLGMFGQHLPKRLGLFGSIFVYGLGIFTIGRLAPSQYWVFVCLSFFVGISIPFYHGITRAIYQLSIPQEYLGRAFAISQSFRRLGMPVGLLLGGFFSDTVGIHVVYSCAGLLAIILALTGFLLPSLRNCGHTPNQ